ncbi:hypothetical protein N9Y20_06040, partial [Flavobacteriaceae bacterium]|nr:hypothetical protein [Flavobacteriaceae bacterium]
MENLYRDEWKGSNDWLNTKNKTPNSIDYLSYNEAKNFISELNLKNFKDWQAYSKTDRPYNIPSNPQKKYDGNGWNGWEDFLPCSKYKDF